MWGGNIPHILQLRPADHIIPVHSNAIIPKTQKSVAFDMFGSPIDCLIRVFALTRRLTNQTAECAR